MTSGAQGRPPRTGFLFIFQKIFILNTFPTHCSEGSHRFDLKTAPHPATASRKACQPAWRSASMEPPVPKAARVLERPRLWRRHI